MEQIWNGNDEKCRNNGLKNYGLCPSHYLREPGLSWDAMLKMTKIKLEPIIDPDMYIFFEKGTGDGVSYISSRYSKSTINIWSLITQKKNQKISCT